MRVKDLMSKDLFTLRSDHTLDLAEDVMGWQRVRHVPVINAKGELAGLLTHRDILKASVSSLAKLSETDQRELNRKIRIGDIMSKAVHTTTPETDLREAAAVMIDEKIGCLPVVDGKRLVGILTEADFLTLAWEVMGRVSDPKEYKSVRKYC